MRKVADTLKIPSSLDLSEFSSSSAVFQPSKYELRAIVVHEGSLQAGHYYAAVSTQDGGDKWIVYDDHNVHIVKEESVLRVAEGMEPLSFLLSKYDHINDKFRVSATGYLLFYSRRNFHESEETSSVGSVATED